MIFMNLEYAESVCKSDADAVLDWCKQKYDTTFATYFQNTKELYQRLRDKHTPVTDQELETILMDLPMELFSVSEDLSAFRLKLEVIKLKNKEMESDLLKQSTEKSAAKRQEEVAVAMLENKLLVTAYSSVISRVENQISFCRELIMSAKKIWDGRRKTDMVNPIKEVTCEDEAGLPEYGTFPTNSTKTYIKGR